MSNLFNVSMRSSGKDTSLISTTKPTSAYTSKASDSTKTNPEIRDLKLYCDQLYKEIERKDGRNDTLTKEMQSLRIVVSNLQVTTSTLPTPCL
jgi:hypothetical protein